MYGILHYLLVQIFLAMKCSLRYHTIVTKFRITVAVACSWLVAVICAVIDRVLAEIAQSIHNLHNLLYHIIVSISLLVISY